MRSKAKFKSKKSIGGASSAGWEYFDDCLICQAMEKSEKLGRNLSGQELMDIFRKANKANEEKRKQGK